MKSAEKNLSLKFWRRNEVVNNRCVNRFAQQICTNWIATFHHLICLSDFIEEFTLFLSTSRSGIMYYVVEYVREFVCDYSFMFEYCSDAGIKHQASGILVVMNTFRIDYCYIETLWIEETNTEN